MCIKSKVTRYEKKEKNMNQNGGNQSAETDSELIQMLESSEMPLIISNNDITIIFHMFKEYGQTLKIQKRPTLNIYR